MGRLSCNLRRIFILFRGFLVQFYFIYICGDRENHGERCGQIKLVNFLSGLYIHIYVCIYFPMREVDRRFESVKFIPALFFFISRREKNYEGGKFVVENCKEIVNICREY